MGWIMGKRPSVDLRAISVEFQVTSEKSTDKNEMESLAMLYLRAFEELGLNRKTKKRPVRVRNAPRRKSIRGVSYGT